MPAGADSSRRSSRAEPFSSATAEIAVHVLPPFAERCTSQESAYAQAPYTRSVTFVAPPLTLSTRDGADGVVYVVPHATCFEFPPGPWAQRRYSYLWPAFVELSV